MRILNCMLSRKRGGVEEAFLNYTRVLVAMGFEVSVVIHPACPYRDMLETLPVHIYTLRYFFKGDPLALFRLRRILRHCQPEAILAHATRAMEFMTAIHSPAPLTGIFHGGKFNNINRLDKVIVLTDTMRDAAITAGGKAGNIHVIPNMVEVPGRPPAFTWRSPLVLGMMARLEQEKGGEQFLKTCEILKKEHAFSFKVVIAGDGRLRQSLEARSKEAGLEGMVQFVGWSESANQFFQSIDIFCLPSLSETFGIAGLEAMAHNTPIIATQCDGPSSYMTSGENGILVPVNDPAAMAEAIKKLAGDMEAAQTLAAKAYATVQKEYSMQRVGERIREMLVGDGTEKVKEAL